MLLPIKAYSGISLSGHFETSLLLMMNLAEVILVKIKSIRCCYSKPTVIMTVEFYRPIFLGTKEQGPSIYKFRSDNHLKSI